MHILIADDDLVSRRILARSLAGHGDLEMACNGDEAWEAVSAAYREGDPYRIILLDIMMPGMDGQMVLRKIRELEASLGIVGTDRARIAMATGLGDSGHVLGSFREECDGYIRKPYTRDSVLQDLRKYEIL